MNESLFIGFGLFTIACAVAVVFAKNAVYSAFSLILAFFGLATLYLLWGTTFLAMIQILIYAGAIVVLFVFVTMLLNLGRGSGPTVAGWLAALVAGATVWSFSLILLRTLNRTAFMAPGATSNVDMRSISRLLFTDYLWPFEILSIFLLALIIAVYTLTRPETPEEEAEINAEAKRLRG